MTLLGPIGSRGDFCFKEWDAGDLVRHAWSLMMMKDEICVLRAESSLGVKVGRALHVQALYVLTP